MIILSFINRPRYGKNKSFYLFLHFTTLWHSGVTDSNISHFAERRNYYICVTALIYAVVVNKTPCRQMYKKSVFCLAVLCLVYCAFAKAQGDTSRWRYEHAYQEMVKMLDEDSGPIRRAVYLSEWAFLDGALDYDADFCRPLAAGADYMRRMIAANHWESYKTAKQIALCNYFFYPCSGNARTPFEYDTGNEFPEDDWHYQLVSRTIRKHLGQCHSLPWAFKLYAEELGAEVFLAHAPRHCFIVYEDKDNLFPEDWVNVEVTAHQYQPTWAIKEHFAITDSSIIAGTYLTPITNRQTIACQLSDLALGYYNKYNEFNEFTLKCAEKSLQYYGANPNAIIIKAKSLEHILQEHLLMNGNCRDALTELLEKRLVECSNQLQATYWTEETEELRKKWEESFK